MKNKKWFMIIGTIVLMMAMMFVGCDTEQNDSSESDEVTPQPVKHYTVRFNVNGGTGTMADVSANVGQEITIPDCTFTAPTGQEFVNWNTLQNGSGTSYQAGAKVTDLTTDDGAVVTLFAKWGDVTYTYTFNANGGNWGGDTANKIVSGMVGADVAKPADPMRTGWTFDEWNEDVPSVFGAESKTFTAQWTANTYTIKFDKNGGTGDDMANLSMTYDESKDLTANSYTRDNYVFKGWATSADGEIVYTDNQNVKNLTDVSGDEITLYAIWLLKNGLSAKGNIILNCVEYEKTSMKQVLNEPTSITCDRNDGSNNSVFPTARGSVTLGKYAIGKYPVTQELYRAVMGSNPSNFKNSTPYSNGTITETNALLRPVEKVSWYDAITFCNKLSLLMGKDPCYTVSGVSDWSGAVTIPSDNDTNWDHTECDFSKSGYRLPTECEWECAARGGTYSTETPWTYTYSGSNTIDDVAWYSSNSSSHTWEVGLKAANDIGLYDMSGNVWEWCWDYSSGSINSSTPATGPTDNSLSYFPRRIRGGS